MAACLLRLSQSLGRMTISSPAVHRFSGVTCCNSVLSPVTNMRLLHSSRLLTRWADPKVFSPQQMMSPLLCQTRQPSTILSSVPHRTTVSLKAMHKNGPPKKTRYNRKSPLDRNPFKKGVVLKVIIKKPKKPNSANRKCVRVKLTNGKQVVAFIPGEGHNLQEHNIVLVRGGKKQDLPGVKHKVVRGKYDCGHVVKKTA